MQHRKIAASFAFFVTAIVVAASGTMQTGSNSDDEPSKPLIGIGARNQAATSQGRKAIDRTGG